MSAAPASFTPTISVRLLWPYIRLRDSRGLIGDLEEINPWLVDPDARLAHAEAVRLMMVGIEDEDDPPRGLRAAALVEPEDRDPVEYAARGCSTLGEALAAWSRWFPVLNSASALSLTEEGERVQMVYRVVHGQPEPPSFADSVIAGLVHFIRRNARIDERGWELTFTQPEPSYRNEYSRFFSGAVRFAAPVNALVLPRAVLAAPMLPRSPTLTRAYQLRADQLLHRLRTDDSTVMRVRELVVTHLGSGQVTMNWAASQLAISVPTLRRRLRDEDTTFSSIVEDVRRNIAQAELRAGRASIGEIARALGFSTTGAFDRAFRRWSGAPPSGFRTGSPEAASE